LERVEAWRGRLAHQDFRTTLGAALRADGCNLARALDWLGHATAERRPRRAETGPGVVLVAVRISMTSSIASVVQSEVFNRYLTRATDATRLPSMRGSRETPQLGQCVRRRGSRKQSLAAGSPGTFISPAASRTQNASAGAGAAKLEHQILAELGMTARPAETSAAMRPGRAATCSCGPNHSASSPLSSTTLRLGFVLPPGAYATELFGS